MCSGRGQGPERHTRHGSCCVVRESRVLLVVVRDASRGVFAAGRRAVQDVADAVALQEVQVLGLLLAAEKQLLGDPRHGVYTSAREACLLVFCVRAAVRLSSYFKMMLLTRGAHTGDDTRFRRRSCALRRAAALRLGAGSAGIAVIVPGSGRDGGLKGTTGSGVSSGVSTVL